MTTQPTDRDPFEHDDAAYVLGALDAADAAAFEAHLATCRQCQERVQEARSTVALLGPRTASGNAPTATLHDTALPDTVLPALVRTVRRERRRRQGTLAALGAVAAACLIAFVVSVWPNTHPAPHAAPQAMSPVGASPVRATAQLTDRRWGTSIDLHCRYAKGFDSDVAYYLRVVDRAGGQHGAGSWELSPGGVTDFVGGTQVRRARIGRIQVTLPNGQPVLELAVH
ncbi:anti-sigma factor family protein [uncultured Jatrophihabitans sp.]|uniref:anti-sigma factor family protein n=1 Tax=uncultured Jatrophihabitans sp. TaxID=1610747 RepID=UPI0035CAEAAD